LDDDKLGSGVLMVLPCQKRVRAVFAGQVVADSRNVLILRGQGILPVYYFPRIDVKPAQLRSTGLGGGPGRAGPIERFDLAGADREVRDAAWSHPQPADPALAPLKDHIAFVWEAVDAWFEEDEEVFVHPRDPQVRVDTLQSSAHIQVMLAGVVLADSHRPLVLVETNHPVRYYLPPDDCRLDLLAFSPRTTRCPYKGTASYWSAVIDGTIHENVAWTYRNPIAEILRIKDLIAFYPEAVDAILRDGEKLA
jgi:uncharacterized protein (DUF427 family)